jgi:hypothetical protein
VNLYLGNSQAALKRQKKKHLNPLEELKELLKKFIATTSLPNNHPIRVFAEQTF